MRPVDLARRVLPRWRRLRETPSAEKSNNIARRLWGEIPLIDDSSLEKDSGDLSGTLMQCWLSSDENLKFKVANQILLDEAWTPTLKDLALRTLPAEQRSRIANVENVEGLCLQADVHKLKETIRRFPKHAYNYVDIALLYTSLGQFEQAEYNLRIALLLAPTDRFCVRSAVRFLVHVGEPEKAWRLVRARAGDGHDPWLTATEISLASMARKRSRHLRGALSLVEDQGFSPHDRTELRSVLATEEMENGKIRHAKRLFRESLTGSNDNSLAQFVWASKELNMTLDRERIAVVSRPFEAETEWHMREGNWEAAVTACHRWARDEAFSVRPAATGSYIALCVLNNVSLAETFIRKGVVSNPRDPMLLNNEAVCLALRGKISEAHDALSECMKVIGSRSGEDFSAVVVATAGLIELRSGNIELGRELYCKSIESFKTKNENVRAAVCALFWAREEISIDLDKAELVIKDWLSDPQIKKRNDVLAGLLKVNNEIVNARKNYQLNLPAP